MHQSISARRRLAIVLNNLSSTVEYRTIANLFGVSISFVCSFIKEVSSHCSKDENKVHYYS